MSIVRRHTPRLSRCVACGLILGLISMTANAQQWRVVEVAWKGEPDKLGPGTLKDIKLKPFPAKKSAKVEPNYYSPIGIAFSRRVEWASASDCSIVENLDTNAGTAGFILLSDRKHAMIQLHSPSSFLLRPRICIQVVFAK